ncbi:MAG: protein-export chaperone SecB [Acidobacteria bacterium]|nr:protein-export chaperone SecB [Acidobacteriota bacterium]
MTVNKGKEAAVFHFDRVYLKDASFESPRCPQVFSEPEYNPNVDVQLRISHQALDQERGVFEVVLKVTVTATTSGQTAFLTEVQQAGTFTITGLSPQQREQALEATCPNALFPFVREHVNHLVTHGGFPSLLLQPVNFETMYEQKKASGDNGSTSEGVAH